MKKFIEIVFNPVTKWYEITIKLDNLPCGNQKMLVTPIASHPSGSETLAFADALEHSARMLRREQALGLLP